MKQAPGPGQVSMDGWASFLCQSNRERDRFSKAVNLLEKDSNVGRQGEKFLKGKSEGYESLFESGSLEYKN